jgi:ATP-dependent protease HslVU (ClpYQ) peptidase subunit
MEMVSMTCIVGLEHAGKVLIGGDSAGTAGWSQTIRADEKVWRSGEFVYGFTSSFRMGQLLRYGLSLPRLPGESTGAAELVRWMSTEFIDAVRTTLKEGGYAKVENGVETGGTFLVGWRGSLYYVDSDFQVGCPVTGEAAVGCGGDIAVGALHASRGRKPRDRVRGALEAAAELSAGVAGPFKVVTA